jgi:hypothetical protein
MKKSNIDGRNHIRNSVNPDIILGKFQRKMDTFSVSNQGASTSRNVENWGTRNVENKGVGG